jgi:heme exporter protein C
MTSLAHTSAPVAPAKVATVRPVFDWLIIVAILAVAAVYVRAIYFTPVEALQGEAQKIYYIHLSSILGAYLSITITALMSLVALWLRDERADRLAEASAEVGLVFLTVVLTTGPIWGHKIWGAWWAWWDARLTLTLFLWLVIISYLVLRGAIEDAAMRTRYSAVLALLGALLIPFIHLSVYMFAARLHPMPVVLKPDRPSLAPEMLTTLLLALGAFFLLCVALMRARYRLGAQRELLAALESEGGVR